MFQDIKNVLTPTNSQKILSIFQVKHVFTVSEAEVFILAGYAMQYTTEKEQIKSFLSVLPFIQEIKITGLPEAALKLLLSNWILEYYSTIYFLLNRVETHHQYIVQILSSHIIQQENDIIYNFILNSEKFELQGVIIEAWSRNPLISPTLGRALLHTVYFRYLRGRKIDIQFTSIHSKIIELILAITKNQPEIIEQENNFISEIFKITFKFANKFLNKKTSSKRLFIVCVEFQLYCITFQDILEMGLKNFNLRSVYGKYPLIKCWLYYTVNLLSMLNEQIILEVLTLYLLYLPTIFEDHYDSVIAAYLEVLMLCNIYIKNYTETLLKLIVESIRKKPECIELYRRSLEDLPEFIRDYAKWEYIFIVSNVTSMPGLVPNSFNSIQCKEEAHNVFQILHNKILQLGNHEFKGFLEEIGKIIFHEEAIEFLCDRFVELIKGLDKIGVFNRYQDSVEKIIIFLRVIGEISKEIQPSHIFNALWANLYHFQVQTDFNISDTVKSLKQIAEKTIWAPYKYFDSQSLQYLNKIKQKLKCLPLPDELSYSQLLNMYTNYEILQLQNHCDFFLPYCLNSALPLNIQEILLGQYLKYLQGSKYCAERISNDLKILIKYVAENNNRKFIKSLINMDAFSVLETCYCYKFIQIHTHLEFFKFSLNLLGCASLNRREVYLHHVNDTLIIENPKKFYAFLMSFVTKSVGYALTIARMEMEFCCAMFLNECNKSQEDAFSRKFIQEQLKHYTAVKISRKAYSDIQKFHLWFHKNFKSANPLHLLKKTKKKKNEKLSKSLKHIKNADRTIISSEKILTEIEKEINSLSKIFILSDNSIFNQVKEILMSNMSTEYYNKAIDIYIFTIFSQLKDIDEGLLYLTWIICAFPVYSTLTLKIFKINLLKFLSSIESVNIEATSNIVNQRALPIFKKSPYITTESIQSILKFLKNQFYQCILRGQDGSIVVGEIVEQILTRISLWDGLVLLEICTISLQISQPEYALPNIYQLHALSISALFSIQFSTEETELKLNKAYLTLMKVMHI